MKDKLKALLIRETLTLDDNAYIRRTSRNEWCIVSKAQNRARWGYLDEVLTDITFYLSQGRLPERLNWAM